MSKETFVVLREDHFKSIIPSGATHSVEADALVRAQEVAKEHPGKKVLVFKMEQYAKCDTTPVMFHAGFNIEYKNTSKSKSKKEELWGRVTNTLNGFGGERGLVEFDTAEEEPVQTPQAQAYVTGTVTGRYAPTREIRFNHAGDREPQEAVQTHEPDGIYITDTRTGNTTRRDIPPELYNRPVPEHFVDGSYYADRNAWYVNGTFYRDIHDAQRALRELNQGHANARLAEGPGDDAEVDLTF